MDKYTKRTLKNISVAITTMLVFYALALCFIILFGKFIFS